jgi:hypothetical protein
MATIIPNHLNSFPAELWQEVFSYFSANELWRSFRGLNAKIDAIIDRTSLYLNLQQKDDYYYFNRMILPSLDVVNVRSLILEGSDQIKQFFSTSSLDSLVQLHVLSLYGMYPSNDLSFKLWNQLASLKYLRSLKLNWEPLCGKELISVNEEKAFIIKLIFNKDVCSLLERFSISSSWYQWVRTFSLMPTTKATKIKYLSLNSLSFDELIKLLPDMQNVKSLQVAYLWQHKDFTGEQPRTIITTMPLLPRCVELELELLHRMTFAELQFILQQTPNLKKIHAGVDCEYDLLYAQGWERLLSTYCPKVSKFTYTCTGNVWHDHFYDALHDFEGNCKSVPFWIERKATVTASHEHYDDQDVFVYIEFDTNNGV